jgi:regulatory protein YycI of two-component signal transduction system YycFG
MNTAKKKEKFQKRFDKASKGDTVKVIEFKRKHFKEELSTNVGFGYQDLKEDSREFFNWMISEKMDFKMEPTDMSRENLTVLVTVTKAC